MNRALRFDRSRSYGYRLNIPAGTAVRFEPGEGRESELVALGGLRRVYGMRWAIPARRPPTPEPVRYRPMFGALGSAMHGLALSFVSQISLARGMLPSRLSRTPVPVRRTRGLRKVDMMLNDTLPAIEVDPETYSVTVDGSPVTSRAIEILPLAQRYFLF